ncbi:MAG: type I-E CRISPR-associated protein Cas6/Cse3/CasE [Chloroflexota bacterium]
MTYLSQLSINPRNRKARRDLSDAHNLHRTVMSAFPQANGSPARERFGVLHRLDGTASDRPVVVVQSEVRPEWRSLEPGYLRTAVPAVKDVGGVYGSLRAGQELLFRLRANPTRRLSERSPKLGKSKAGARVEIRSEEEQLAWLRRKAEQNGFELLNVNQHGVGEASAAPEVPAVDVRPHGQVTGSHGKGEKLTFGAVTFQGVLRIADSDRFQGALVHGIGSGKAYGFGLLSIAPMP